MTKKKIFLLSAIAILAVTYIFQLTFSAKGKIKTFVTKEIATKILIENNFEKIELSKNGDAWITKNNLPTNKELVDFLNKTASNLQIVEKISKTNRADELEKYGLKNPITVTLFSNNKNSKNNNSDKVLQKLFIGKPSMTTKQTYISLDGKKGIFLASGNLSSLFGITEKELLDFTLYSVNASDIYKIDFSKLQSAEEKENFLTNFSLEKSGEIANIKWELKNLQNANLEGSENLANDAKSIFAKNLSQEKIESWLNSITELNATSWIEDFEELDFDFKSIPTLSVTLGAAGKNIKIDFYKLSDLNNENLDAEKNSNENEKIICICKEDNLQNSFPCYVSKRDFEKFNVELKDFIE